MKFLTFLITISKVKAPLLVLHLALNDLDSYGHHYCWLLILPMKNAESQSALDSDD